ncbi:transposase [Trichloromonas sp.]|uniref:transposase n=1 Tax=Trichloromonas sp. TaxID=3069249 RepID=UPI002A3DE87F|nr:hypothetical protein [Trichloromonas sp.]
MTMPRSNLVSLSDTPWYHVVSRCVRRAYLCGEDTVTGMNFDHRRGWIETRIRELASIFAIDIAAYAVMSNHYHLVVRIDEERTEAWSDEEVLRRWVRLFTGPVLVQRYLSAARDRMSDSERLHVREWVETYRARLHDLSWFMRVLNETLARMANAEDGCTGRFWEGRFKSQALLDEQAVLMAMAYVDLNPIRAGMAETPEQSTHTSVKQRVEDLTCEKDGPHGAAAESAKMAIVKKSDTHFLEGKLRSEADLLQLPMAPLLPFEPSETLAAAIPFAFDDYLDLVDTLGRAIHLGKRGSIPEKTPAILTRLGIDAETFINHADCFLKEFGVAVGTPANLVALAATRQSRYLRGISTARAVFEGKGIRLAA